MGFFTRTAMDMLMKTTHPEINRRQCWNLHPHRKPCTECKDICPYGEQIFTRPNLVKDWDPCTECGLCVSACRSGCIIPSPEQVQRDTSAADTDNDTIWIGCEKSTRKNSMVRTCISALTWETLAYLALNKKIVLDLTPCGECENLSPFHFFRQYSIAGPTEQQRVDIFITAGDILTFRSLLHIVILTLHQTGRVCQSRLCLSLGQSRVYIGYTQSKAQTQCIGKTTPFVHITPITFVIVT